MVSAGRADGDGAPWGGRKRLGAAGRSVGVGCGIQLDPGQPVGVGGGSAAPYPAALGAAGGGTDAGAGVCAVHSCRGGAVHPPGDVCAGRRQRYGGAGDGAAGADLDSAAGAGPAAASICGGDHASDGDYLRRGHHHGKQCHGVQGLCAGYGAAHGGADGDAGERQCRAGAVGRIC